MSLALYISRVRSSDLLGVNWRQLARLRVDDRSDVSTSTQLYARHLQVTF